jgi:hypothetical protein
MTEASANLRAAAQVLDLFVDQLIADETPFVEVHTALSKLPPGASNHAGRIFLGPWPETELSCNLL